jgi:hypothetical protein
MTGIEVARAVVTEKQCHLARPRQEQAPGEPIQYDCKPTFTGSHKGWQKYLKSEGWVAV